MILAFLVLGCTTPAGKMEDTYMGQILWPFGTVETEQGTELALSTFILEGDVSPLCFVKPSFLLRQVRCPLRPTLGLNWLEELA